MLNSQSIVYGKGWEAQVGASHQTKTQKNKADKGYYLLFLSGFVIMFNLGNLEQVGVARVDTEA